MIDTANINLHHCWYNFYGHMKAVQESRVGVGNINQGVVLIIFLIPLIS